MAAERVAESIFGFVVNFCCDVRNALVAALQSLRGKLKTPLRQVGHWRLGKEVMKAGSECRARHPDMK